MSLEVKTVIESVATVRALDAMNTAITLLNAGLTIAEVAGSIRRLFPGSPAGPGGGPIKLPYGYVPTFGTGAAFGSAKLSDSLSFNYDNVNAGVSQVMRSSLTVLHLDSSFAPVKAPLVTMKTFTPDWQAKRQKPSPLDNYFNFSEHQWDALWWDGMFRKDLTSIDSARIYPTDWPTRNDVEQVDVVAEFQLVRDGKGTLYLPELLAVQYHEVTTTATDNYVGIGPLWINAGTNAYARGSVTGALSLGVREWANLFGWSGIDEGAQEIKTVDLRNNHGRGEIYPLRWLQLHCTSAVGFQARLIYRYAPVSLNVIYYLNSKYIALSTANEDRMNLVLPEAETRRLQLFIDWYNTYYNGYYHDGTADANQTQVVPNDE